jgi:hypothetical protein
MILGFVQIDIYLCQSNYPRIKKNPINASKTNLIANKASPKMALPLHIIIP